MGGRKQGLEPLAITSVTKFHSLGLLISSRILTTSSPVPNSRNRTLSRPLRSSVATQSCLRPTTSVAPPPHLPIKRPSRKILAGLIRPPSSLASSLQLQAKLQPRHLMMTSRCAGHGWPQAIYKTASMCSGEIFKLQQAFIKTVHRTKTSTS